MCAETPDRPLISFVVFAYNQEKYIREAIEGAFAQTYSPLEIILSDDHSQDRTYEIMKESAARYRGPHTVLVRQSGTNCGLIPHINTVMGIARGELIVVAAGDDISLPERCTRTWELWRDSAGTAKSIYFSVELMYEDGAPEWRYVPRPETHTIEWSVQHGLVRVLGASQAWHRSVFDVFGPLPTPLYEEDSVIPFRALLLGRILHQDLPMVRYRQHTESLTRVALRARIYQKEGYALHLVRLAELQRILLRLEAFRADLNTASQLYLITAWDAARYQNMIVDSKTKTAQMEALLGGTIVQRLASVFRLLRNSRLWPLSMKRRILYACAVFWPSIIARWDIGHGEGMPR